MEEPALAAAGRPRFAFGFVSPRAAVAIAGAIVIVGALSAGGDALGPFIVGLVVAYLLGIPSDWLARRGVPRWVAVLAVYGVTVVLLVQSLRIMLRPLADEIATFITEFPSFTAQISERYAHLDLPPAVRQATDAFLANLASGVGAIDPATILPVASAFAGALGAIVAYIIVPVWAFYLIKDRPALMAAAERSLPAEWRPDARAIAGLTQRVFSQWLRGQVVLGVAVGLATFVGLLVLSATVNPVFGRFAIFLSVIAGVFELLPIIGPILSAIPAVLLGLTAGIEPAIAALLLYLVVQQLENNFLVPKIQGDAVELHPTIVMVALVVGGAIGGLLGAILALPITASARDMFRYVFHRVDDPPSTPEEAVAIIRAQPTLVDRPVGDPTEPAHDRTSAHDHAPAHGPDQERTGPA